jgi:hypothetical protein
MMLNVPVSVGELVDKITILNIKNKMIADPTKLANIRRELEALLEVCRQHGIDPSDKETQDLERINLSLWKIEDDIRDKERDKSFDKEFIELARAVYVTNDERFRAKAVLNEKYGSTFKEEKSYKKYL